MPQLEDSDIQPAAGKRSSRLDDRQLVEAVLAGRTALYESIMRRYNQRLFRLARSILRDDGEAEEVVQDTYVKAWFSLADYRGSGSLGGWLARIAANEALARRRRAEHRVKRMDTGALERAADRQGGGSGSGSAPEDSTQQAQLRSLLESAIDELPEPFRMAFVMREVEQLSVRETAEYLGIEQATVKTRVHRARRQLRELLDQRIIGVARDAFAFAGARCNRIVDGTFRRIAGMVFSPERKD